MLKCQFSRVGGIRYRIPSFTTCSDQQCTHRIVWTRWAARGKPSHLEAMELCHGIGTIPKLLGWPGEGEKKQTAWSSSLWCLLAACASGCVCDCSARSCSRERWLGEESRPSPSRLLCVLIERMMCDGCLLDDGSRRLKKRLLYTRSITHTQHPTAKKRLRGGATG